PHRGGRGRAGEGAGRGGGCGDHGPDDAGDRLGARAPRAHRVPGRGDDAAVHRRGQALPRRGRLQGGRRAALRRRGRRLRGEAPDPRRPPARDDTPARGAARRRAGRTARGPRGRAARHRAPRGARLRPAGAAANGGRPRLLPGLPVRLHRAATQPRRGVPRTPQVPRRALRGGRRGGLGAPGARRPRVAPIDRRRLRPGQLLARLPRLRVAHSVDGRLPGRRARRGDTQSSTVEGLVGRLWDGIVIRLYEGKEQYGGLQQRFTGRNGLILPGETRTIAEVTRAVARVKGNEPRLQLLVNALVTL